MSAALLKSVVCSCRFSDTRAAKATTTNLTDKLSGRYQILVFLIVLLWCAIAFSQGLRTTADLDWPYEEDLHRDIGHAQTIADGDWWGDPLYVGEYRWYNPFLPALVATTAGVMEWPVHRLYTRLGAYLNLLAPLTFFVLVRYWFDQWIALAGLLGFLFVITDNAPAWYAATYSPWLMTATFGQTFFYLTLLAYSQALTHPRPVWYLVSGGLLSLTFLTHTAPALILGCLMVVMTVSRVWQSPASARRQQIFDFGGLILVALIVSSPFSYSIVYHYQLHIQNNAPSGWGYTPLSLDFALSFIKEYVTGFSLIALLGLTGLLRHRPGRLESRLIVAWLLICVGFVLFGYLGKTLQRRGIDFPVILPAVHFLFYIKALESILFGYGLMVVAQGVAAGWGRLLGRPHQPTGEIVALMAIIGLIFVATYPAYLQRDDFVATRAIAQRNLNPDQQQIFAWLRQHTQPTDVFLTSNQLGLFLVGPAGRKVVTVDRFFSNPYVNWQPRQRDAELMVDYLLQGNRPGFQALVEQYHVTYLLTPAASDQPHWARLAATGLLCPAFSSGPLTVYRLGCN